MNAKRVRRIWRRARLKVPQQQPQRGRRWRNDGSCIRRRPGSPHHVWSDDFVMDRTHVRSEIARWEEVPPAHRDRCVYQAVHGGCRRAKIELRQCTALSDRALRPTWPAASYPFRQRLRVYRSCRPRRARQDRRRPSIWLRADRRRRRRKPREGVILGERIQRELQLKAPARNPEHGDLLYTEGGQNADRTMAASLQYHPAA